MANFNKRNIIKYIFNIICIAGLIFQSKELLRGYLSGETVISMEIKHLDEEPIPSLTICISFGFSLHQVCKEDIFQIECEKYFKKIQEYFEIYYSKNESLKENLSRIEYEFSDTYYDIRKKLLAHNIDIVKFLRNHSINLHLSKEYDREINLVWAVGKSEINDSFIKKIHRKFTDPIDSVIVPNYQVRKCFTLFSFLQEEWRSIKMKFVEISIKLYITYRTMPIYPKPDFTLAIHSPNTLPNFDEMASFHPSKGHEFLISQINTELLEEGFDTDCFKYDLDYKHGNYNMFSDCITSCVQNYFMNKNCIVVGHLYRFQLLDQQNGSLRECHDEDYLAQFDYYLETYEYKCKMKCKKDCLFKYYTWTHKEFDQEEHDDKFVINVMVHHNYLPDVIIKYIEKTSFISFVCNFGGLLGMWLGLSIMVIFGSVNDIFIFLSAQGKLLAKNQEYK